jgi:hypothetical protein
VLNKSSHKFKPPWTVTQNREDIFQGIKENALEDNYTYCVISVLSKVIYFEGKYKILKPKHVARMGEKRNEYGILVGTPEGKRPLGRRRCKRVDNIKIHLT